jgi:cytochrome bd-type quinol oxidase subunit 2
MDLNSIWFWLIAVLIIGYAILDGFDFGVGVLSLFGRDEKERRIHFNAIGPVWDGNEVWLITGGGALFAAFPIVYATVFSGFYLALMLLLTALRIWLRKSSTVSSLRYRSGEYSPRCSDRCERQFSRYISRFAESLFHRCWAAEPCPFYDAWFNLSCNKIRR